MYIQTGTSLLANNSQHCWMLPVACCCVLLRVVAESLKPVKLLKLRKTDATLWANNSQQCWEFLRLSAGNLIFNNFECTYGQPCKKTGVFGVDNFHLTLIFKKDKLLFHWFKQSLGVDSFSFPGFN